jgi:tetratricopeptide (TPR) repeat protein
MYEQAEEHLRRAIRKLSAEYTRPVNTEAYYHLGLALKGQGRLEEAYDAFYRATWDYGFHSAAYYQLATLSAAGDFARPWASISPSRPVLNTRLPLPGRCPPPVAGDAVQRVLTADPLDFLAMNRDVHAPEGGWPDEDRHAASAIYLELAADYMDWGLWDEAIDILQRPVRSKASVASTYPMVYYYRYLQRQKGQADKAAEHYRQATRCRRITASRSGWNQRMLKAAIRANPSDARAYYYLRQPALRQSAGEGH